MACNRSGPSKEDQPMSDPLVVVITDKMIDAGAQVLSTSDDDDRETAFNMIRAVIDASEQLANVPE